MFFLSASYLYRIFIDPVLSRFHKSITENISTTHRVLDVACGTGSLSLLIAQKAFNVAGIDNSPGMIATARRITRKRKVKNANFETHDASDFSIFDDKEFDVAVISMAVHQFNEELAIQILKGMKRIASKVIIMDYNFPARKGFSHLIAYAMEFIAGGDHFRNFKVYRNRGGISYFATASGLDIRSAITRGRGVFSISVYE